MKVVYIYVAAVTIISLAYGCGAGSDDSSEDDKQEENISIFPVDPDFSVSFDNKAQSREDFIKQDGEIKVKLIDKISTEFGIEFGEDDVGGINLKLLLQGVSTNNGDDEEGILDTIKSGDDCSPLIAAFMQAVRLTADSLTEIKNFVLFFDDSFEVTDETSEKFDVTQLDAKDQFAFSYDMELKDEVSADPDVEFSHLSLAMGANQTKFLSLLELQVFDESKFTSKIYTDLEELSLTSISETTIYKTEGEQVNYFAIEISLGDRPGIHSTMKLDDHGIATDVNFTLSKPEPDKAVLRLSGLFFGEQVSRRIDMQIDGAFCEVL